jgi:hypothetical protein
MRHLWEESRPGGISSLDGEDERKKEEGGMRADLAASDMRSGDWSVVLWDTCDWCLVGSR